MTLPGDGVYKYKVGDRLKHRLSTIEIDEIIPTGYVVWLVTDFDGSLFPYVTQRGRYSWDKKELEDGGFWQLDVDWRLEQMMRGDV